MVLASELGRKMVDLKYCVKTADSLERKIADKMKVLPRNSCAADGLSLIHDIVHFTRLTKHDDLASTTMKTVAKLQHKGYDVIEIDNKWLHPKNGYRGIHLEVCARNGCRFELQIHSIESLKVK